jgi:hypothetical protein
VLVSEETVKVGLGDDYYQGAYYSTTGSLLEYEVPRSQLERWEAAQAAYSAMQDEIGQVMREQAERIRALRKERSPSRMTSIIQDIYGPAILAQLAQPITIRIPKEPE